MDGLFRVLRNFPIVRICTTALLVAYMIKDDLKHAVGVLVLLMVQQTLVTMERRP
jgi:hypothetical protein